MSRRITILLLAASATLIATQASADRECFEDSCRVLEAAQPPAETPPAPVAERAAEPQSDASASVAAAAPESVKPETTAEAASAAMPAVKAEVPKPVVAETAKAEAPKSDAPKTEASKPAMPQVVEVQKPKLAVPASKVNVVRQVAPAADYSRAAAEPSRPSVAMKPSPVDAEPVRLVRHRAVAQRIEPRHAEPGYVERRRVDDARPRARGYAQADTVPPAVYVVGGPPVAGAVVIAVPGAVYPVDARPIYMLAPNAKIISVPSAN
jgi:hypothetical protein